MTACQTCRPSERVYEPATPTGALCTAECSSGGFNCAWCRPKDRQLCGHLFVDLIKLIRDSPKLTTCQWGFFFFKLGLWGSSIVFKS